MKHLAPQRIVTKQFSTVISTATFVKTIKLPEGSMRQITAKWIMLFCVYLLSFGYVLLWRNLFGTYYYLLDIQFSSIPGGVTCLIYVLVSVPFFFLCGENNSIVLFPTVTSKENDIIEVLDQKFLFDVLKKPKTIVPKNEIELCQITSETYARIKKKIEDEDKKVIISKRNPVFELYDDAYSKNEYEKNLFFATNAFKLPFNHVKGFEHLKTSNNKEIQTINNNITDMNYNNLKKYPRQYPIKEFHPPKRQKSKQEQLVNRILLYIWLIHYKHIILNVIAGLYWSSIWRLYDYLLEIMSLEMDLAEVWKLFFIAVVLHFINHFILLPNKQRYENRWILGIFNMILGAATAVIWASNWYILDRLSNKIG